MGCSNSKSLRSPQEPNTTEKQEKKTEKEIVVKEQPTDVSNSPNSGL
jgi:hypothetical protein